MFVILFKVHNWDETVARQYERVVASTRQGDVIVLADITNGPIVMPRNIRRYDIHSRQMAQIGIPDTSFWFNGDFATILFFLHNPHYEYYVSVEYDVAVLNDMDLIVQDMKANDIDAVYEDLEDPLSRWPHLNSVIDYYNFRDIRTGLFCISFFSRRAVAAFYARRLHQAALKKTFGFRTWPIGEAVMASEMRIAGLKREYLARYCSNLDNYHWNRGMTEEYIKATSPERTFLHPVCNDSKCITTNLTADIRRIDNTLLAKAVLMKRLGFFVKLLGLPDNSEDDRQLVFLAALDALKDDPQSTFLYERNVSVGAVTSQSSISDYSSGPDEAGNALREFPAGHFSFHTDLERSPWWEVDLQDVFSPVKIYLFDRTEINRSANLVVSVGADRSAMTEIFRNDGHSAIGNIWSGPTILETGIPTRFVRLSLEGDGILHFDSIIVTTPRQSSSMHIGERS